MFPEKIQVRHPGSRRAAVRRHSQRGYSYLLVMVLVVALGVAAEAATTLGSREQQAEREAELWFRGLAYQRAVKSYYDATSPHVLPKKLEDLLRDPRFPLRRHLRALYADPFARPGGDENGWRVLRGDDGGIVGVASQGQDEPLRRVNLPQGFQAFAGVKKYADIEFTYIPPPAIPVPAATASPTAARNR